MSENGSTTGEIEWFAAGGGIRKSGPFDSQVRAWASLELADGVSAVKPGPIHVEGARVWPEIAESNS